MTGFPTLTWFRKPFGPGDTDGDGAKKLLGQPQLTISELLVRETGQNSWDAAIDTGELPEFQMRYREISDHVRHVLQTHVFTEVHKGSDLDQALHREHLDAVEIIDRGTRGLGGPTRNDRAVVGDQITDYADFVLTVGAPPDHKHGGGTYGYGKTASYMASSCSTIVIWSRSRDRATGRIIERFIASAMDSTFTDASGKKYTGRQWWGLPPQDSRQEAFAVEPVAGDEARKLGEALFERHFEHNETGTSLLIMAPRTPDGAGSSPVQSWAEAIEQNLWPKMIAGQDHERTMQISLVDRGQPVPLGNRRDPYVRKAREDCLLAVRAAQAGQPQTNPLVEVKKIRHGTLRITLGHLAMTKVLGAPNTSNDNSVTYMRHLAELVVCEDPLNLGSGDGRWVAVFKPVEETDRYFAMSEPPAHDSWNPRGMTDAKAKTCVNVALRDIKQEVKDYLRPAPGPTGAGEQRSTGKLAATLGSLVMGVSGSRPLPGKGTGSRRRRTTPTDRSGSPKVDIVMSAPILPTSVDVSENRQRLVVRLGNPGEEAVSVKPGKLAIAIDGQTGVDPHEVELAQWVVDGATTTGESIVIQSGDMVDAHITSPRGVAVEFTFVAEEEQ